MVKSKNRVVANAAQAAMFQRDKDIVYAYQQGCLKAAKSLLDALNSFDAAYTNGAKIADRFLPPEFTGNYLDIVSIRTPLRLFMARCQRRP